MSVIFDWRKFYNDLNTARKMRAIAWNKVATRAGIAPTAISAFVRQFETPDSSSRCTKTLSVENTIKLLYWLNKTDVGPYMVSEDEYVV